MHPRLLLVAIRALTRLPIGEPAREERDAGRSLGWFSVVGALVGGVAAFTWWTATLALPRLSAAVLAVAVTLLLTGATEERGAAVAADGLAVDGDVAARLGAMRDTHVGPHGMLALIVALLLKVTLLASLPPVLGAGALVAVSAVSRGVLGLAVLGVPAADPDDQGATVLAHLRAGPAIASFVIGIVVASATLRLVAVPLLLLATAGLLGVRRVATDRLGGLTSDVMGAMVVAAEVLGILAVAVATGDLLAG